MYCEKETSSVPYVMTCCFAKSLEKTVNYINSRIRVSLIQISVFFANLHITKITLD